MRELERGAPALNVPLQRCKVELTRARLSRNAAPFVFCRRALNCTKQPPAPAPDLDVATARR